MFSRFTVFLALICCGSAIVHAQDAAPPPLPASTPDPLADDLKEYVALYNRGLSDELIATINAKIAALPEAERARPDPRLLYLRGLAYCGLGFFDLATPDLLVAQQANVKGLKEGLGPDWILGGIKRRAPLLPPKMQEIRDGDRVILRMHTFGAEGGAATITEILSAAARIDRQIFGADLQPTTVYAFDTYEQYVAYFKAFYDTQGPGAWSSAVSTLDNTLIVILRDDKGMLRARDDSDSFKATLVQEYSNALLSRRMERRAQRKWFTQGLAQVVSAQVDPTFEARKQKNLKRLFQNNALLSLDDLNHDDSFPEEVELKLAAERGDANKAAPDFYTQSYGLTKTLLDNNSTAQLQSFLKRVRASKDFDGAFAEEFGMTTEQFYQKWKADTAQQLGISAAQIQTNAAPPTATTAADWTPNYSSVNDAKYRDLLDNAFFDEIIYNVNAQIQALPDAEKAKPDPRLLWFRGMASYKLGHLSEAKADLTASKNDGRKTYGTTEKLASIESLMAVRPPKMEEVRVGNLVIFRAHHYETDAGADAVLALLPDAYRISREMFGTDVAQTTVYIFDTYEQFTAYENAYYAKSGNVQQKESWVSAVTVGDVVLVCLQKPNGEPASTANHQDFVIVHEYNHAMFSRLMGFSPQPRWFLEGIAQVCETRIDPSYLAYKEKLLRGLFANNTLISLAELQDSQKFNVQVEAGLTLRKQGNSDIAPDPYTQGYGMAKYLLKNISTPQLQSFLNRVRQSKDFNASFAAESGFTVEQFDATWRNDTARQMAIQ